MNEILEQARAAGFTVDKLVADGKIHRFKMDRRDDKESGWYLAFQNFTRKTGQVFHVALFGSWRSDEKHVFKTNADYSREDLKAIQDEVRKVQARLEAERRKKQEEVAHECEKKWASLDAAAGTLPVPYQQKKGLAGLYGARPDSDGTLFVPMRDADGKLWSLQRIQPDGGKFFESGGRVRGTFHAIGTLDRAETIYVCEGFATGASIHEAVDRPVVVAFNAGNLLEVAPLVKEKYPDAAFVICGDEDAWTTKPDGTVWNPGRERAEEAARKVLGVALFPKFESVETKPTDFNDLAQLEGLDVVREQLGVAAPEAHWIMPLGYDGSTYFFLSNVNPQIQSLASSSMGAASLCRLQPLEYWESLFPASNGENVAWTRAANDLMQRCHARGIFKTDHVRGRGVWRDGERIVYHMGDRLYYDGREHDLHRNSLGSKFIYEMDDATPAPHAHPLTVDECLRLRDALAWVSFKHPESATLLAGWLVTAPVCGALAWRPHVWLTGPSGTGKSYLMQQLINRILGGFSHYFQGQTTEAGVRQSAGRSTRPVIFDEFETNERRSEERVRAVLELARQASSESDAIVAKGTVSGDAIQFRPRFSMLVASVRVNLVHEEDRNRFTVVDLERSGEGGKERFDAFKVALKAITPEFGARLFARTLRMMPVLRRNAEVFQEILGERFNMRLGQQVGALLAGYALLTSDESVSEAHARAMVDSLNLGETPEDVAIESDENNCLDYLLQKIVRGPDGRDVSIVELVRTARSSLAGAATADEVLGRYGVRVEKRELRIRSQHSILSQLYSASKWSGGYAEALSRLPGAERGRRWFLGASGAQRCVVLPLEMLSGFVD